MFKKNKFIMFTVIALLGCFTVSQASYISYDWDKDFKVKGKRFSHIKKQKQDYIDLLTFGMKGNQFKSYSYNNVYTPYYGWNSYYNYNWNSYVNYGWNNYYSYGWNNYYSYNWNSYANYDWSKSNKDYSFHKPTNNTSTASVFEPSLFLMLVAGLFGVASFKKVRQI